MASVFKLPEKGRAAAVTLRVVGALGVATLIFLLVNWIYQVTRKPTELLFPVSRTFTKSPAQTWHEYSGVFRQNATAVISAPFLAALAQVEASGNPLVQTYWRWSWLALAHPFEIYKPASSAVGMYQMTNSTFEEARHYCIRDHVAIHDSADGHICPPMRVHTRLLASDAVELTAAYLDVHVASIVARLHGRHVSLRQKQELAVIIHLCGAGAADAYARRGFKLSGERCGDHDPRAYLTRFNAMKAVFVRMAKADGLEGPAAERTARSAARVAPVSAAVRMASARAQTHLSSASAPPAQPKDEAADRPAADQPARAPHQPKS